MWRGGRYKETVMLTFLHVLLNTARVAFIGFATWMAFYHHHDVRPAAFFEYCFPFVVVLLVLGALVRRFEDGAA
jgi:hypothetical protein